MDINTKIQKIKQVRILQNIQSDVEKCIYKNLINSNTRSLSNIKKELNIIFMENNILPNVEIEYDKLKYIFTIKLDNTGLKIITTNTDYFI